MWPHMWNGAWWPGGLFMGLFWLVLFGLVVFLAVYAAQNWNRRQTAGGPPTSRGTSGEREASGERETPREVLDRRYAEGEISRDEYEQMKRDLE